MQAACVPVNDFVWTPGEREATDTALSEDLIFMIVVFSAEKADFGSMKVADGAVTH
ncbi:hypothetical protein VTN96DRAFT_2169 [Rasamsonia emersonii]